MKTQSILIILCLVGFTTQAIGQTSMNNLSGTNEGVHTTPIHHLWGDCNNDGLQDILVMGGQKSVLFRNLGNGEFEDITSLAFPDGVNQGIAGIWGDYDGNETLDLFLLHQQGFTLYHNSGGLHFSDVTTDVGLDPGLWGTGIHLEDYDKDGYEDLLVLTPRGDLLFHNLDGTGYEEVDLPGVEEDGSSGMVEDVSQGIYTTNHCSDSLSDTHSERWPYEIEPHTADGDWKVVWPDMHSKPSGNVGIGTTNPEGKLDVVTTNGAAIRAESSGGASLEAIGSSTLGSVLVAPSESASGDDAELQLAEDNDYTFGMSLKYDGGDNKMYVFGKSGSSTYGPHLAISRNSGDMELSGDLSVTGDLDVGGAFTFPIAFDSGWLSLSAGYSLILSHNLGGDPDKYIVHLDGSTNSSGAPKHQAHYGSAYYSIWGWVGCEWSNLDADSIEVARGAGDNNAPSDKQWDFVRVRILRSQ